MMILEWRDTDSPNRWVTADGRAAIQQVGSRYYTWAVLNQAVGMACGWEAAEDDVRRELRKLN
jgi:hypothetical protein